MRVKINSILFFILPLLAAVVLFGAPAGASALEASLPAPTMVGPERSDVIGTPKPMITGLTKSGTEVYIYIDGRFNGKTDILRHDSGTASFAYRPFLDLSPGKHTAWAVAKDEAGNKSRASNVLYFSVEAPYPAPTVFKPVETAENDYRRPVFSGLAKNNSVIRVFIDHEFYGEFDARNHASGTASFRITLPERLAAGSHLAYLIAVDPRGKESPWSELISFDIRRPAQPAISAEAAFDRNDRFAVNEEGRALTRVKADEFEPVSPEETDMPGVVPADKTAIDLPESEYSSELEDFLGEPEVEAAQTGIIDESKTGQSRLDLNLALFLLFLLAVIAWIFWVNRELIKEKRAQDRDRA